MLHSCNCVEYLSVIHDVSPVGNTVCLYLSVVCCNTGLTADLSMVFVYVSAVYSSDFYKGFWSYYFTDGRLLMHVNTMK